MVVHGSAVAWQGQGVLITGPSGSGKSSLALALIALGLVLVADDRTVLSRVDESVIADAPEALRGLIEARHLGILRAGAAGPVPIRLVVDLSGPRAERLPQPREVDLLGIGVAALTARYAPELAPALRQYLIGGRAA